MNFSMDLRLGDGYQLVLNHDLILLFVKYLKVLDCSLALAPIVLLAAPIIGNITFFIGIILMVLNEDITVSL